MNVSTTHNLPIVKGKYKSSVHLAPLTWFKVGGIADAVFIPAGAYDLADFLKRKAALDVVVLGAGSNVIIRDKGIRGVVIKLLDGFTDIEFDGPVVKVGCGLPNHKLMPVLCEKRLSGLEFLCAIPGTIGGAIAMNAGCYGSEISNFLINIEGVNIKTGDLRTFSANELSLSYRKNPLSDEFIFTSASFLLNFESSADKIKERMDEILKMKAQSQPIKEKTGGSTFKNPNFKYKAWELIDMSGFRGYRCGGAMVSPKHSNFLINHDNASAEDLETLGAMIIDKVKRDFGVQLKWEIKCIGEK